MHHAGFSTYMRIVYKAHGRWLQTKHSSKTTKKKMLQLSFYIMFFCKISTNCEKSLWRTSLKKTLSWLELKQTRLRRMCEFSYGKKLALWPKLREAVLLIHETILRSKRVLDMQPAIFLQTLFTFANTLSFSTTEYIKLKLKATACCAWSLCISC